MKLEKTVFCLLPRRTARRINDAPPDKPNMVFTGWIWLRRAVLLRNINHGTAL